MLKLTIENDVAKLEIDGKEINSAALGITNLKVSWVLGLEPEVSLKFIADSESSNPLPPINELLYP